MGDINQVKEDIKKILDKLPEDVEVLLTGYAAVSKELTTCTSMVEARKNNDQLLKIGDEYDRLDITTVDVWDYFKTKPSDELSDAQWYDDSIHLNRAGYRRFFTESTVNEFLCGSGKSDTTTIAALVGVSVAAVLVFV